MVGKENKTVAYVYKWVHTPSLKWYIGSRTAKGCHPEDGYVCSSKVVKPLIQNNPQDWVRTIIEVGEPVEMRKLEAEILTLLDAKNDPRSFNMQNGDGKFTTAGMAYSSEARAKMSATRKGRKLKPQSPEHRAKRSAALKGKTLSPAHRAKIGAAAKGRTHNHDARAKMSASQKGKTKSPEHCAKLNAAKIKPIVATNLSNGATFEITGGKQEMSVLGFNNCRVSECARGKRDSHKGHSFRFKNTQED